MIFFLGYASYYRKFINGFANNASPLQKLVQKCEVYAWDDACEQCFKALKEHFEKAVVLPYPDFTKQFILNTDANNRGIWAVLSQIDSANKEKPIAFYSGTLSKPELRYSVTRKERLALVNAAQHLRVYLYGRMFVASGDHSALQWLQSLKDPRGQMASWLEHLAE